jgi:hypothetical protein
MPWLILLLQAAGLVVAAAVVAAVSLGRVERGSLLASGAAVASVAFLLTMAPQTYGTLRHLNEQRLQYRGWPADKARGRCLIDAGFEDRAPFFNFVRDHVPATARYVVVGSTAPDLACFTFVLSPRLIQADRRTAGWVMFTDGMPPEWRSRIVPGSVRTFRRGRLVARLR